MFNYERTNYDIIKIRNMRIKFFNAMLMAVGVSAINLDDPNELAETFTEADT